MDFELTDEQRMLKDSVLRLIAERYSFEKRKTYLAAADGWSRDMWRQYAELGVLGLPFAESDGGLGAGPVETMIVMDAFGRGLVLEPYLATVVLGGGFLRLAGSPQQRETLIPRIADGTLVLAFAHSEDQSRYSLADVASTARRGADQWVLDGKKRFVLHGASADKLIVSARVAGERCDRSGIALFLVDSDARGVSRRDYLTQDRLRAADVTLSHVRLPADALLGVAGQALPLIEQVTDQAIAALCAEAVGCMERAHEITVEYMKIRKQFGVPIGSFQALQHRAVDMLVMIEQARSMALYATMSAGEPATDMQRRAIAAAKVQIGNSSRFVGQQAIQLHGGIGVTEECEVGHHFRRLSMIEMLFGDSAHHLAALAAAGGLIDAAN